MPTNVPPYKTPCARCSEPEKEGSTSPGEFFDMGWKGTRSAGIPIWMANELQVTSRFPVGVCRAISSRQLLRNLNVCAAMQRKQTGPIRHYTRNTQLKAGSFQGDSVPAFSLHELALSSVPRRLYQTLAIEDTRRAKIGTLGLWYTLSSGVDAILTEN